MSVTDAPVTKRVAKITNAQDIYDILDFVRDNRAGVNDDPWLELDFREIGRVKSQRNSTHWIEILSNELLGELASTKLVIRPPATRRGRTTLERAGLSFAIAQRRPTSTSIRNVESYDETWPADDWSRTWSPADSHFHRRLFREDDEPDELVRHTFLTFLNPHHHICSGRLGIELADYQAHPWVVKLLRHVRGDTSTNEYQSRRLIRKIDAITYELVENLDHAFPRQPRSSSTALGALKKSYVQLYRTSGGGKSSHDRLHLVVADTGIGVISSLRSKLGPAVPHNDHSAEELISRLLEGTLPSYGRDAGRGYRKIIDVVGEFSGELYLTTGSARPDEDCDVYRAVLLGGKLASSERLHVQRDENLKFIGTTVHAVIPLSNS